MAQMIEDKVWWHTGFICSKSLMSICFAFQQLVWMIYSSFNGTNDVNINIKLLECIWKIWSWYISGNCKIASCCSIQHQDKRLAKFHHRIIQPGTCDLISLLCGNPCIFVALTYVTDSFYKAINCLWYGERIMEVWSDAVVCAGVFRNKVSWWQIVARLFM